MKLLTEMLEMNTSRTLVRTYKSAVYECKILHAKYASSLTEGLISDHNGELERQFDEIIQRLKAAHRALSLIAKLPKEQRREHKSRVFKNMNHINKMLYDIMLKLGYSDAEHNIGYASSTQSIPSNQNRQVAPSMRQRR